MECELMLFVKNHIPYLWDLSNCFSNSFIDFYSCQGFHQVIYQKEWSIKLRIDNGGWHETLNLLHVSRCEMLHFVTSYMKQNKSGKQTLESAQYGLEISFKMPITSKCLFSQLSIWIYPSIIHIAQWTCGKKAFDLDKMLFFKKIFFENAILVPHLHQTSLGL